jgi:hypothetical protein
MEKHVYPGVAYIPLKRNIQVEAAENKVFITPQKTEFFLLNSIVTTARHG